MQAMPRQFRYAGPMLMKNNSDASLTDIRLAVARHPTHIKYVAIYKMNGGAVVLARAQDKLSVSQWRSILGTGVQEIKPIEDLTSAIHLAKQQDGFEEYGSMSRKKPTAPRVFGSPVEVKQEQVAHVDLRSPSPEPGPMKQEDPAKSPYMTARLVFLKTLREIRRKKKLPKCPVDLSLADYKPRSLSSKQDVVDCNQQASMRARTAYIKYLEDYRRGRE